MQRKTKLIFAISIAIVILIAVLALIRQKQTAREAWVSVLGKCADTEVIGHDFIFFGLSNEIGPGSVWRKAEDGSFRLRFELSDIEPDAAKRQGLIRTGNTAVCQGGNLSNWSLNAGLPFEGKLTPVSGTFSSELRKAQSVAVGVDVWSIDVLKEVPYEQLLTSLKKPYDSELTKTDRLVIENAVKLSGFKAAFNFSKQIATDLKTKYSDESMSVALRNGPYLDARWTSDTTLTLSSPDPFYMLAAFGRLKSGSLTVTFTNGTSGLELRTVIR